MNDFRTRLLVYMGAEKLTARAFEARTGISKNTINGWMTGRGAPAYTNLRRLAETTGRSAAWWLGLEEL